MKPGQPSETAIRIAISKVAATLDPELRALLSDPDERWSEAFVRAHSPEAVRQLAMWRHEETRPFARKMSEAMEPGGPLFILLRKRFIEDRVATALAGGVRQLVVLGAGYDPLSLSLLARFEELRAFEVDHPPTQEVKRRALQGGGVPERLALLAVDMSEASCEGPLREAGHDPARPTVFVAEGVLMYLAPAEVDRLMAAVRRLSAPGSPFVFTVMDDDALGRRGSPAYKTAQFLRLSGEPLRSGQDMAGLEGWLAERRFRLRERADAARLKAEYLTPAGLDRPVGEGEVVVVAEAAGQL